MHDLQLLLFVDDLVARDLLSVANNIGQLTLLSRIILLYLSARSLQLA